MSITNVYIYLQKSMINSLSILRIQIVELKNQE